MKAILYLSQATIAFNEEALCQLASSAAAYNATQGITGYLWFKRGQFVQYIEGETEKLNTLMASITHDPRHQILHQIEEILKTRRRFPEWNMRYFSDDAAYEIGLETIFGGQLLLMDMAYKQDASPSANLWQMVETISTHTHKKSL